MNVVIVSNVLFRALISQGNIFELLFNFDLNIFAPEILREEFSNNKEEISRKSKISPEEFDKLFLILVNRINFVLLEEYQSFIPKAKLLLGSHEKDIEFVALGLLKNAKVWTYEELLFKIGVGISTKEVAEELRLNEE